MHHVFDSKISLVKAFSEHFDGVQTKLCNSVFFLSRTIFPGSSPKNDLARIKRASLVRKAATNNEFADTVDLCWAELILVTIRNLQPEKNHGENVWEPEGYRVFAPWLVVILYHTLGSDSGVMQNSPSSGLKQITC